MMTKIIILGSTKGSSNTKKILTEIFGKNIPNLFTLSEMDINPYNYECRNQNDDFIPLIEKVIKHDMLILATPVHWYSVSTVMKIFIDRISDLLDLRKDLGKRLRNRKLFVIASFGNSIPKGFEENFQQICDYLGMEYLGTSFICCDQPEKKGFIEHNQKALMQAKLICYNS